MQGTELQNLAAIHVYDIGNPADQVKVTVPSYDDEVKIDHVLKKICEQKGVKECNAKYFCVVLGGNHPIKKFKLSEKVVLPLKGLYFQKWCFNIKNEKRLMRSDRAATELFFLQAQHDISIGKLKPSTEQFQKLQECLHPEFMAIDQYLSICQTIPGYFSVTMEKCQLIEDQTLKNMSLPHTCSYNVNICRKGLSVISETSDAEVFVQWYEIISWRLDKEKQTVTYFLQLKGNQSQSYLPLKSPHCEYMACLTIEMINELQAEDEDAPCFHVSNIKSLPDGSTLWENILFDHDKVR